MARPEHERGPWESFNVRMRRDDLALLDAARGDENRSKWAREQLLATLSGGASTLPVAGHSGRGGGGADSVSSEVMVPVTPAAPARRARSRKAAPAPPQENEAGEQEPPSSGPSWMRSLPTRDERHQ